MHVFRSAIMSNAVEAWVLEDGHPRAAFGAKPAAKPTVEMPRHTAVEIVSRAAPNQQERKAVLPTSISPHVALIGIDHDRSKLGQYGLVEVL